MAHFSFYKQSILYSKWVRDFLFAPLFEKAKINTAKSDYKSIGQSQRNAGKYKNGGIFIKKIILYYLMVKNYNKL